MDSSALFKQYEQDYCNKSTDISRKIGLLETLGGDARRKKLSEIETDMRQAEDVLKRMDLEVRSLPADQSRPLQAKVKEYKADLASLKSQTQKAASALPAGDAARAELGLGGDYASSSAGQRDRMLTATQRLEKTNEVLDYGKQTLIQTEEMGVSILRDLHSQRETIQHSHNTLHGADDNITKSRKILSNMARRLMQNKLIMAGVIVFLLLAIGLIIWAKVR